MRTNVDRNQDDGCCDGGDRHLSNRYRGGSDCWVSATGDSGSRGTDSLRTSRSAITLAVLPIMKLTLVNKLTQVFLQGNF